MVTLLKFKRSSSWHCDVLYPCLNMTQGKEFVERIVKTLHALSFHMRSYSRLDFQPLNDIYRKTEEYSHTAVNKFNVIPHWVFDFMPNRGGYFIGNVSPARMDFRWFALGNCVAILSSLATPEQSMPIMDLIESRWQELIGEMPTKIAYPAIDSHEWRIVTGCDPKNTRWSCHKFIVEDLGQIVSSWRFLHLSLFGTECYCGCLRLHALKREGRLLKDN